jgi:hypothetical protein
LIRFGTLELPACRNSSTNYKAVRSILPIVIIKMAVENRGLYLDNVTN